MKKKEQEEKAYRPGLPVVRADAAGIDLGSREHWVCCPQREAEQANVRQFATTTVQRRLAPTGRVPDGCAMESTGFMTFELKRVDRQLSALPEYERSYADPSSSLCQ